MAAAYLSRRFSNFRYTLIDLRKSGQVEAAPFFAIAHPELRKFNGSIGLKEQDFIRETAASFYLGDKYIGFGPKPYVVPYGDWGTSVNGVNFLDVQRAQSKFETLDELAPYSLPASLIAANRFLLPDSKGRPIVSDFDYGYQFDPSAYGDLLLKHTPKLSPLYPDTLTWNDGHLVIDGTILEADLFIDGSGFENNVFGEIKYNQDWSEFGFPTRFETKTTPRTSEDDLPVSINVYGEDPAKISFSTQLSKTEIAFSTGGPEICGRQNKAWTGNVLKIGLSQSRQTPMQGMPLRSVIRDLQRLADLMPMQFKNPIEAREYNRLTAETYDRMRDLQAFVLHKSSAAKNTPAPLQDKLRLFKARGKMVLLDHDTLFQDQWSLYMLGHGITPERIDPLASLVKREDAERTYEPIRNFIQKVVQSLPSHSDFIARKCAAENFKPVRK